MIYSQRHNSETEKQMPTEPENLPLLRALEEEIRGLKVMLMMHSPTNNIPLETFKSAVFGALGWQGGTIHQVVEEIRKLKHQAKVSQEALERTLENFHTRRMMADE